MPATFKPYTRFGMSRIADQVVRNARWIERMRSWDLPADHPDFNPEHPRSVARALREGAAAIIAGNYEVTA